MGKKDRKENKKQSSKRQHDIPNKRKKGRGKGKTKQDKNWDKYFKEFQDLLQPKGIYMRDVEGDGNCLFRSVADLIEGYESHHEKYREMAVDYITKNKEYFALFLLDDENIDEYIKDISEDGTWGGHFELVALSSLLRVKFCLHMKDKDPVIVKSSEKDLKGTKIVHLAYHIDEHYSSIRKIGDDEKAPAEDIRFDISDSESDGGDSTEGSDKEMSTITKEVEDMYINDKKKNKNKKGKDDYQEERKESRDDDSKGKHNKNKVQKEEKNKPKNKKGK